MTEDPLKITTSFVTYMSKQDYISEYDSKLDHLWERIEQEIRKVIDELDLDIDCYGSSVYAIGGGSSPDNSGRCVVCDEWVSAQNQPNIIQGLGIGAEYCGDLYCREHLPKDSPFYTTLNPRHLEEYFDSI